METNDRVASFTTIVFSLVIVSGLWYLIFVVQPLNFWLMMSIATTILIIFSLLWGSPLTGREEWNKTHIVGGLVSAVVLYAIFFIGNTMLKVMEPFLTSLLATREAHIGAIYANRGGLGPGFVALLLFFPIGFGEEIFWRGFIQRSLERKFDTHRFSAFLLTTLIYTLVHVPTQNPILIIAALTCGLFWGGLYWWRRSLLLVLLSHMLWDPMIFVFFPLK